MRKGYLTPPVLIALALITLFVAATIFINTFLLKGIKKEPVPSPTPSIQRTPQSTTEETANWKTYTNTKYDYTLKYPQIWRPLECDNSDSVIFGLSSCETDAPGVFSIKVSEEISQPLIKISDEFKVKNKRTINLDNEQGEEVLVEKIESAPGANEIIIAAVAHKGINYSFNLQDISEKETFNQILSTFKFVE